MEKDMARKYEHLAGAILNAWQEGHGGSAETAHIFQGHDGIVLMIPKALYQAELNLLRSYSNGASLLDRYLRSILETVADEIPFFGGKAATFTAASVTAALTASSSFTGPVSLLPGISTYAETTFPELSTNKSSLKKSDSFPFSSSRSSISEGSG